MIKGDRKKELEKAKEFMMSAIKLGAYIENLQARLKQLETKAQNKGVPDHSELGTRVSAGLINVDNLYCTIMMVKDSIAQNLLEFQKKYKKIESTLLKLENAEMQLVLDCRYLQGMPWSMIAEEYGYCERTLYRIHKRSLERIAEILESEE